MLCRVRDIIKKCTNSVQPLGGHHSQLQKFVHVKKGNSRFIIAVTMKLLLRDSDVIKNCDVIANGDFVLASIGSNLVVLV